MNVKKTIATIGLTGMIGLTLGMAPAVAADGGKPADKGNSVSQSAQTKEKGASNKEAAHKNAPGQAKKAPAPEPAPEPAPAPIGHFDGMEQLPEPTPAEEAPAEETTAP